MPEESRIDLVERLIPLLAADGYGLIEAVVHGTIPLLPAAGLADVDGRLAAVVTACAGPKGDARRD